VDEIINGLVAFRQLFSGSPDSSLPKGAAVDVTDRAASFGVRYVLEGTFAKAGKTRVRSTDSSSITHRTGVHIFWGRTV